jgi:aquaporin Z
MLRKMIVELIGTFFLVFTVGQCCVSRDLPPAPLAIGAALMVMVYAGGYISGGHYNPAVSLAVCLRGGFPVAGLIAYVIVQLIGGALAAEATIYFKQGAAIAPLVIDVPAAMLAEFLFTFALAFVVLSVATAKSVVGNSYYGLAIGSTVMVGAFAVGGVSGGAFNPAVALGITIMHLSATSSLWVLWLGEVIGAAAAAGIFRGLKLGDA